MTKLLRLPEAVFPVFGLCIGYPGQEPERKPRLPTALILSNDTYPETDDLGLLTDYDETVRSYYGTRIGGGHGRCWSEQVSLLLDEKSRPHMLGYLHQQGFARR